MCLKKKILVLVCLFFLFPWQHLYASQYVNIYSARKEALIKPLLKRFYQQTGIKVRLLTGKADALLKRIKAEGANTHADLLLTTDAGRLYRAKQSGVLQTYHSETLNQSIPIHWRDPDNFWFGLSLRARPIFISKNSSLNIRENVTYEDLVNKSFKGQICIRSSNNIYNQSLVASMINAQGADKTQAWADQFVKNFARKPKGGDKDQILAVAAGQCDIAIVNTYYFGQMLNGSTKQKLAADEVNLVWPNQTGRGTHVNVSGIGITKHAKNIKNAQKLIEFLAGEEQQQWYAAVNYEYPVNPKVEPSGLLKSWGNFKADELNLNLLGENNREAVKIMDRANWR